MTTQDDLTRILAQIVQYETPTYLFTLETPQTALNGLRFDGIGSAYGLSKTEAGLIRQVGQTVKGQLYILDPDTMSETLAALDAAHPGLTREAVEADLDDDSDAEILAWVYLAL